jgi:hypothetical protein
MTVEAMDMAGDGPAIDRGADWATVEAAKPNVKMVVTKRTFISGNCTISI